MKLVLKLVGAALALVVLAVASLAASLLLSARTPQTPVGMTRVLAPDPGHAAVPVTLYYPTEAKPKLTWMGTGFARLAPGGAVAPGAHPLVVITHGTGAGPVSHIDTALALAEAGYVVAAPMHPGDNYQDQSAVGTAAWFPDRARQVVRVNDFLLGAWKDRARLDPARVGVFGFSAGGTTALIVAGGTPDLASIAAHCRQTPEFACQLMKPDLTAPQSWTHDARVRAAVVAAPGVGFAFAPDGLKNVRAPVQLWTGAADTSVPTATNAGLVRDQLPEAEFHTVMRAGHFAFLAPCGPAGVLLPPMLCRDPEGFDRTAFHKSFNRQVVAFFDRTLGE
ncbi:dienelactone hydrolase family protein [Caulobacter sp. 17J80-11]|uniref:alpha/beta hydrolase family protein n=1 Tax=Caulobacter sp. 17J80-11 TaxID=2763502 RepID=UPI001653A538|nr:dienelactone hydrolase family protein [Caulobacter sp. 17J80-11]MBC6982191.1 dienelactone hydrolase family protein [Caulobacter sp. 17J80-11]